MESRVIGTESDNLPEVTLSFWNTKLLIQGSFWVFHDVSFMDFSMYIPGRKSAVLASTKPVLLENKSQVSANSNLQASSPASKQQGLGLNEQLRQQRNDAAEGRDFSGC
ncbi:hypothetical protein L2E82_12067 [Cichorium intybus]|uniref:Uncharacterized protein n=1 Tax=Cichorium intybus TaxID=13427 RepID=A0ACB9GG25_CICIN|nr:hypothetical protein L2E82_12067 [Cichorium intybus]